MLIDQGADTWFWLWVMFFLTVLLSATTWYLVITGRDRPPRKQRRGEETIVHYGDLSEDRAPMPKFIFWLIIATIIWAIVYTIWTGVNGLGF